MSDEEKETLEPTSTKPRRYAIMQMGWISPERYDSRAEAEAEAELLNAEMLDECGQDVGDGAATVIEVED